MPYYIRYPKKNRKSFKIIKREHLLSGSTTNKTIQLPEIDAVNQNLHNGLIDGDTALKHFKAILIRLQAQDTGEPPNPVFNSENEALLKKYWSREYSHRELVDSRTAQTELERSVKCLGPVSLLSASQEQIQRKIDQCKFTATKQRRIVSKLKSLLVFAGRFDVKLRKDKKERLRVSRLTEKEFNSLGLSDLGLLAKVLYCSGMRLGEAFALEPEHISKDYILVNSQIDSKGRLREPKWGSTRKTFIQRKHIHLFQEWVARKTDFPYSRSQASKLFSRICYTTLKRRVSFNSLRHSYAINLLSKGVSMAHVAQCLGNSEKVCQEYYVGFELVDESIETIKSIVK